MKKIITLRKMLFITLAFSFLFLASCEGIELKKDKEEDKGTKKNSAQENYMPVIKPENFVASVTNTYFPLTPGMVLTYRGTTEEGTEVIVVTVATETKTILGIPCTVVHDVVSLNGQLIEDTYDWYAQDIDGNVWYMGENVSNYENGVFTDNDGSFETGVDGALPGIMMMANPILEMPYRQEFYLGNAEDWAKVVAKNLTVTTPAGTFTNCIKTEEWNALEPDHPHEYKYHAPGVGIVREEVVGSSVVTELISIQTK